MNKKVDNILFSIILIICGLSIGLFYEDLLKGNKIILIFFTVVPIIGILAGIYHLYITLRNK